MPRHAAHRLLGDWDPEHRHVEDLLPAALKDLQERDRHLARRLVEETLRRLRLLDYWIDHLARRPDDVAPPIRDILRLGLVQIRFLRIPAHAAVAATVSLAPQHSRGFVNALLRRALREPEFLDRLESQAPAAVRASLPDILWDRWITVYGKDAVLARVEHLNTPPPPTFQINRFHPDTAALETDPSLRPVPDHPNFFTVDQPRIPADWLKDGRIYMQDPGAAIATDLLAPQPGESLLDACAAPGGKTRRLAELADGKAHILATDRAPDRLRILTGNLHRLHIPEVKVRLIDWAAPPEKLPPVDAALIDAPCTNTGVLRRRLDARYRFSQKTLAIAVGRQRTLLHQVSQTIRPGGRLVYSTCSLEPEENEQMVAAFLRAHPQWTATTTRFTRPEIDDCDAHFAALLTRRV